jgi:hypothetical protein
MLRYMKDLFPVIWLSKIEIFTAGGFVILKFRNRKEQAENIKQLLMGKIQKQL